MPNPQDFPRIAKQSYKLVKGITRGNIRLTLNFIGIMIILPQLALAVLFGIVSYLIDYYVDLFKLVESN